MSWEAYQGALGEAGRPNPITTEINPPAGNTTYYFAEDYHQQYLAKPGSRPYCSAQPTGRVRRADNMLAVSSYDVT